MSKLYERNQDIAMIKMGIEPNQTDQDSDKMSLPPNYKYNNPQF